MHQQLKSTPSWVKILAAMILGVFAGWALGPWTEWLKPMGDLFIALIRMIVIPVIFISLVCGVLEMRDLAQMRRVAGKTILFYLLTMALSAFLAMTLAEAFSIGSGLQYHVVQKSATQHSWQELIQAALPGNPIKAMAEGQILPVIIFALFLGVAINLAGEEGHPVARWFQSCNQVMFKLVHLILGFAPIGVFALMAWVTATNGFALLSQLVALVGTIYLTCFLVLTVVYGTLLCIVGLNPLPFMQKMLPVQLFAFSTASSNATLPLNLQTAHAKLGVKRSIASFVLPLGSTINMNGLASYLGAVAIFAAHAYGIDLTLTQKIIVIVTTTTAAIGAAGVPGTGLVVMSIVLTAAGLPLEVIAGIAAVDRVVDMINTSTNISGDTLTAVLVANSEGELAHEIYSSSTV